MGGGFKTRSTVLMKPTRRGGFLNSPLQRSLPPTSTKRGWSFKTKCQGELYYSRRVGITTAQEVGFTDGEKFNQMSITYTLIVQSHDIHAKKWGKSSEHYI